MLDPKFYNKSVNTRGIRNNNPFNIVRSSASWIGKVVSTDSRFEQFCDMEHGERAGVLLLRNYIRKSRDVVSNVPVNTISRIISRFAPVCDDNDTESYIRFVCQHLGDTIKVSGEYPFYPLFSRDEVIRFPSDEFCEMCVAIMWYESRWLVPRDHIYYLINHFKLY